MCLRANVDLAESPYLCGLLPAQRQQRSQPVRARQKIRVLKNSPLILLKLENKKPLPELHAQDEGLVVPPGFATVANVLRQPQRCGNGHTRPTLIGVKIPFAAGD